MNRTFRFFMMLSVAILLLLSAMLPSIATSAQTDNFIPAPLVMGGSSRLIGVVSTSSLADGGLVAWIDTNNSEPASAQWRLYPVGSNRFQIRNALSGKCLDVDNSTTINNNSRIQQWMCLGSTATNQFWKILGSGGFPRYQLVASSSFCIDENTGSALSPVKLKSCSTSEGVGTRLVPGTTLRIKSVYSGKCVGIGGTGLFDGDPMQQELCSDALDQRWSFSVPQSPYQSSFLGRCATHNGMSNGVGFYEATCSTSNSSKQHPFYIRSWGDDRFNLHINSSTGPCVDLDTFGSQAGFQDGARIQVWQCNGQANQEWRFYQIRD